MRGGRARIVVIGVGNDWRSDDGVGPAVARLVAERELDDVVVVERDGEATALLDAWSGATAAYVVDATCSGAPPGTVIRVESTDGLPPTPVPQGSHAYGPAEAVALGRVLDRLPERLVVYGIEGVTYGFGQGLSPEVAHAAKTVADRLVEELTAGA